MRGGGRRSLPYGSGGGPSLETRRGTGGGEGRGGRSDGAPGGGRAGALPTAATSSTISSSPRPAVLIWDRMTAEAAMRTAPMAIRLIPPTMTMLTPATISLAGWVRP